MGRDKPGDAYRVRPENENKTLIKRLGYLTENNHLAMDNKLLDKLEKVSEEGTQN